MDNKDISKLININNINPETRFWLVRTKKGFFYDEFIESGFIALGWNIVNEEVVEKFKNGTFEDCEDLEYEFKKRYPNNKQFSQTINKCIRFVKEMKKGDIVMIPSAKNNMITFATVGEYYEEAECTYNNEIEVIKKIEEEHNYGLEITCPYKKRRKIEVLKTIEGNKLNLKLYKVLSSYHGLSNIDNRAEEVLSFIYNVYTWKNKLNLVFNVETKKAIGALDLSSFISNSAHIINKLDDSVVVSTKVNVNSPGQLILSLQDFATGAVNLATNHSILTGIALIWFGTVGGKCFGVEFKSPIELYMKYREVNSKLKNEEIDRETKRIENDGKKIDNELKEFQLFQLKREQQEIRNHCEMINASSRNLGINIDDATNIINVDNNIFNSNN